MVANADDPEVGDTWYVSTENLTLRAEPDALSKAVKNLPYKTAAKVKGVVRVALPFNGDREKFPDTLMPNWVKVEADWRSVQFLKTLGYDTKSLYNVLERFKEQKGTYGGASYPAERGADVLKYMKDFACEDDASNGLQKRTARYREAVAAL